MFRFTVDIEWAIGLLACLILSGAARAGMTVDVTDTCGEKGRTPAAEARDDMTVVGIHTSGPEDLVIRDYAGNPTRWGCAKVSVIHPRNVPEGPGLGETEAGADMSDEAQQERLASFYPLMQRAIALRQTESFGPYRCSVVQCPIPEFLKRGSGFQLRHGTELGLSGTAEYLGTFAFFEATRPATDEHPLRIPFVVLRADPGDWLEFSNRGAVFWKARVTDFKPGQVYFAVVPEAVRDVPHGVWGIYLNSAAASDSVIYVPTQPPLPLPAPLTSH